MLATADSDVILKEGYRNGRGHDKGSGYECKLCISSARRGIVEFICVWNAQPGQCASCEPLLNTKPFI